MTVSETGTLLDILKAAYPNTYMRMSVTELEGVLTLWSAAFAEYPVDLIKQALYAFIKGNKYPPTIAGLQEYIDGILGDKDYESMFRELWAGVCGSKRYEDLCAENRAYIGSQAALDALGQDESTVQTVVKGQYMKRIAEICRDKKAQAQTAAALGADRLRELQGTQAQLKQIAGEVFG